MATQIPQSEPRDLTIGSAWAWDITYPAFPADESWQLSYYLRGPSDLDIVWGTHVTAGSGPEFEVRVTAAQSAALTVPGAYRLVGRVSKAGDPLDGAIVFNEHLLVLADPVTAVNAKSTARQMLEAIDAALIAGVSTTSEAKRITINDRTIEYRDRSELERLRAHWSMIVAIEENPYGSVVHETEFVRG